MQELKKRLGISREGVYRAAKLTPGFPRLCKMNGKTGVLDSELMRFLATLPGIKHIPYRGKRRRRAIEEGAPSA